MCLLTKQEKKPLRLSTLPSPINHKFSPYGKQPCFQWVTRCWRIFSPSVPPLARGQVTSTWLGKQVSVPGVAKEFGLLWSPSTHEGCHLDGPCVSLSWGDRTTTEHHKQHTIATQIGYWRKLSWFCNRPWLWHLVVTWTVWGASICKCGIKVIYREFAFFLWFILNSSSFLGCLDSCLVMLFLWGQDISFTSINLYHQNIYAFPLFAFFAGKVI